MAIGRMQIVFCTVLSRASSQVSRDVCVQTELPPYSFKRPTSNKRQPRISAHPEGRKS